MNAEKILITEGKGQGEKYNNNVRQFVCEQWKLRKKKESVCELQENIITNGKKMKIVKECVYLDGKKKSIDNRIKEGEMNVSMCVCVRRECHVNRERECLWIL